MDPDDIVIAALGVLLTQVRTARRALEEVERSTSRYMGFEFARAFAEGPAFGAPPMYQGALKVHVVNINDLAPGNSFGDLLMGVLGGVGHLVGGTIGGAIGGTVAAAGLPWMVRDLRLVVTDIKEIIGRLGITAPASPPTKREAAPVTPAQTGETLLTTVEGLRGLVKGLTGLFLAGQGGPAAANRAGAAAPEVLTPEGDRWMALIGGVNRLLDRLTQLVNGLILLMPILVGSLALLVVSLPAIRSELLLTFQFILRNVLVLRGVILTTLFETMATAARLAATVASILGTAIEGVLASVVTVAASLLDTIFAGLETTADALTAVVRSLLQWLVNGVFNTLREIGNLNVFRTIDHFVRILPALLEPIFMITVAATANASTALPTDISGRLNQAFAAGMAPAVAGGAGTLPGGAIQGSGTGASTEAIIGEFPDLGAILEPLHGTLAGAVAATGAEIATATTSAFDTVTGSLTVLANRFDAALVREADLGRRVLQTHQDTIVANADRLARAISAPIDAKSPETGLEAIAEAYQSWLTSPGTMQAILGQATAHLARIPAKGEAAGALDLMRGAYDRPRASVEIGSVEIVIEPPEAPNPVPMSEPGDYPLSDEEVWLAWHRHALDLEDRAVRPADLRSLIA